VVIASWLWGAQAASLQPSATCRREYVLGKLPSTAGSQQALPKSHRVSQNEKRH
jgi:hypothetical protein